MYISNLSIPYHNRIVARLLAFIFSLPLIFPPSVLFYFDSSPHPPNPGQAFQKRKFSLSGRMSLKALKEGLHKE